MTLKRGRILIADDNEDILFTLKMLLRPIAETITVTTDPRELLPILSRTHHDVILLDMNFRSDAVSGREGFRWLEEILKLDPKAVVIFITAYADTEKAVQAIKQGATDFIAKPWQNDKMIATVSAALQLSFSRTEVESLKEQKEALAAPSPEPTRIIGESAAMQAIFQTIRKLADTDANLLLLGENGTGKDLIARYVYEQSPRKNGIYVPIDLGSIPETLFESELFGYEKGGCTEKQTRQAGSGFGRYVVPQRNRQSQPSATSQTAFGHRATEEFPTGSHCLLPGRRAADMCHQHRPLYGYRQRTVPARPPLPHQYHRNTHPSIA